MLMETPDKKEEVKQYKKYKQLLYVEDGSVDLDNLEEQLELHGNLDDILIVPYRNGAAKPELVNIAQINTEKKINEHVEDWKKELEDDFMTKAVNALAKLIDGTCEQITATDIYSMRKGVIIKYSDSKETFIKQFLEFYNKERY